MNLTYKIEILSQRISVSNPCVLFLQIQSQHTPKQEYGAFLPYNKYNTFFIELVQGETNGFYIRKNALERIQEANLMRIQSGSWK